MRVGIDTGSVVVSTLDERRGMGFVAVGPTVNRASRLQAAAPVDGILISRETRRQIRGAFGMDERPGLQLKGIDEPVDAWVVRSERHTTFQIDRVGGVEGVETSTVGRDLQLRFLQERLFDVTEESSLAAGDRDRRRRSRQVPAALRLRRLARGESRSPSGGSAVAPRRTPRTRSTGCCATCSRPGSASRSTTPRTRSVAPSPRGSPPPSDPSQVPAAARWSVPGSASTPTRRRSSCPRTRRHCATRAPSSWARYFHVLSEQVPVVILLEDLHWADEGTLRLARRA